MESGLLLITVTKYTIYKNGSCFQVPISVVFESFFEV